LVSLFSSPPDGSSAGVSTVVELSGSPWTLLVFQDSIFEFPQELSNAILNSIEKVNILRIGILNYNYKLVIES